MKSVEEQLSGIMIEFAAELGEQTEKIGKRIAKECAAELRQTSPKDRPEYYKGWTYKTVRGAGRSVEYIVCNMTHPGLTHLLERGHGNADPIPHIGPAEKKYSQKYLEEVERAVQNAGR